VEDDEIPEEYCGLEGSTVQEQLTIVSSRLDQREAEYDSLKTELNKTKEGCINLQGLFFFVVDNPWVKDYEVKRPGMLIILLKGANHALI